MNAAEARAVWMERELHGMKQVLDQMKGAGLSSGYWSEPVNREEKGQGGLPREDRARQGGELPEQDRAWQRGELPEQDRAWQHGDLPGQDRAWQRDGLPREDRAWQHGELPERSGFSAR